MYAEFFTICQLLQIFIGDGERQKEYMARNT